MNELTQLIKEDMKPALGVTEPGAIAFAVASAKSYVQGEVKRVHVALNSGMYKNAYTCGIPNSNRYGNLYAAALGAVAADAKKGLESLADITPKDDEAAAQMVADGKVTVVLDHIGSEITIDATVETAKDCCTVYIKDSHTHIVRIEKNGEVICLAEDTQDENDIVKENVSMIHQYSLEEILEYIRQVPQEEIAFIQEAFAMNLELLEEGMQSERTTITRQLLRENGNQKISTDVL